LQSSVDTSDTATMEDPDMPRRTVGNDADINIGGGARPGLTARMGRA
jgi:hypothetical protein